MKLKVVGKTSRPRQRECKVQQCTQKERDVVCITLEVGIDFKVTVDVCLSDVHSDQRKVKFSGEWHIRFTTVLFKPLSDQE